MRKLFLFVALIGAIVTLPRSATASEPRPPGVSRFIGFSVQPVYPKSYDIVAFAQHSIWGHFKIEELKDAWQKKAVMVANGRKFKVSKLVVHDNETIAYGYVNVPVQNRSVSGTITLTN
jgi:hypothetical protein